MLLEIGKDISIDDALKVANKELEDSDDKNITLKKLVKLKQVSEENNYGNTGAETI